MCSISSSVWDDETERRRSVHAKPSLPHGVDKSQNCQTTNLLGCQKTSKMVPPVDIVTGENVVDVVKLAKEVSLTNTYFLRPLCIRISDTHYCDLVSFLFFFTQKKTKISWRGFKKEKTGYSSLKGLTQTARERLVFPSIDNQSYNC
jgi:hypothetical protein